MQKRLVENILSLTGLRGLEYLLGILLIPYLVRVLGPEKFGAIAFMQGILGYFNILIDYGFNLTAPRDIAQAAEGRLSVLFSAFFWGKAVLCAGVTAVFAVLWILLEWAGLWRLDSALFAVMYSMVLGNLLFPIWFFQGIQQMKYITLANVFGRLVTTACIFLMVSSPADYLWSAFFQSCTPVLAGGYAWRIIGRNFPGLLSRPVWRDIRAAYRDGWHIFISTLAINLYTASNVVILGFLASDAVVGYYSGAAKLIEYVKRLIEPVSQAVYPYVSGLMREKSEAGLRFLKKMLCWFGAGGFLFSLALWVSAPWVVQLVLGTQYEASVNPLRWMAFVPFMVCLSNVLGIQTMLPLGMEKAFSRILLASAVVSLSLIFPLTLWYGASGTAITMLATETFVTVAMAVFLFRKGINV